MIKEQDRVFHQLIQMITAWPALPINFQCFGFKEVLLGDPPISTCSFTTLTHEVLVSSTNFFVINDMIDEVFFFTIYFHRTW